MSCIADQGLSLIFKHPFCGLAFDISISMESYVPVTVPREAELRQEDLYSGHTTSLKAAILQAPISESARMGPNVSDDHAMDDKRLDSLV